MAATEYLTVSHLTRTQLARIFSKIHIDTTTGCWVFNGYRSIEGYGRIVLWRRLESLHRVMYAWLVAPIPRGLDVLTVDHACVNPPCCNPAHLSLMPNRDNVMKGNGPCAQWARRTHCLKGHPLEQVKGRRRCLECFAVSQRAGIERRATAPNREDRLRKDRLRQQAKRARRQEAKRQSHTDS